MNNVLKWIGTKPNIEVKLTNIIDPDTFEYKILLEVDSNFVRNVDDKTLSQIKASKYIDSCITIEDFLSELQDLYSISSNE